MFDFEKFHKNSVNCTVSELNCDFLILILMKILWVYLSSTHKES